MIAVIDFETTGFKAGLDEVERRVKNVGTTDNGEMV